MIYILAPYSLKLNTTSRNRILSFYRAFKKRGLSVAIISPPLHVNIDEWYSQKGEDNLGLDVVYMPDAKTGLLRFLASKCNRRFKAYFFVLKSLLNPILTSKRFNKSGKKDVALEKLALSPQDVIISSHPSPFSLNIANRLVNDYGCKLIVDYRDPWTYGYNSVDVPQFASVVKKKMERKFENSLLEKASAVTVISEKLRAYFPEAIRQKTYVVKNGSNAFHIDPDKIQDGCDMLRFVYLGRIYNQQLQNDSFFKVIRQFIFDNNVNSQEFEMLFVGANNKKLIEVIRKNGLEAYVKVLPTVKIESAIEIGYTASAFLHLRYGDANAIYTSKHADYLALQKPILLPVSDGGALASSTKNSGGFVCDSISDFRPVLQELWGKYKGGKSFKIARSKAFLFAISREAEAEKVVQIVGGLARQDSAVRQAGVFTSLPVFV
ncbi:hypothetical protein [Desertivirga xinjiangensis]|uniref:hypothetical protein n=1 Tax=Desertivirga xinjiangensis TaxID=539206 RepID=UPI00210E83F4|nr:hypothetical protein [Pedobacter xinjiangensis]